VLVERSRSGNGAHAWFFFSEPIPAAHDESEQVTGWFTMLENYLDLPFDTEVLGVRVTVERLDLRNDSRIVATCKRNNAKQVVDITELPLPTPRPAGAEWIEAYCRWRGGR
jgi:hypothetical protein